MPLCPNCGAQQPEGAAFCDECGAALRGPQVAASPPPVMAQSHTVVATNICPVCGARTSPQDPFCTNCGASLQDAAPGPPPAQAGPPPAAPVPGATVVASMAPPPVPPAPAAPAGAPALITCSKCGTLLEADSAFCDMCGAPVVAAPSAGPQAGTEVAPPPEPAGVIWQPAGPDDYTPPPAPVPPPGDETTVEPFAPFAQAPPAPSPAMPTQVDSSPPPPAYAAPPGWPPVAAESPAPQGGQAAAPYGSPVQAKLVLHGTGAALPLPPGKVEILVGREDPVSGIFPDVDLTDYGGDEGGVSRKHARIMLQGGQFFVEDLNSVNHTFVNKERLALGDLHPLRDGDELSFGRVKVVFRLS